MRIVFIGCVRFSASMLRRLVRSDHAARVVGVLTMRHSGSNADFEPLAPIARRAGIDVFYADEHPPAGLKKWVARCRPDIIYCFGWSKLLPPDILRIPRMGAVGYHPSLLPRNRGRHPIIWALALGLKRTGSTFFRLEAGPDSGPILSQRTVAIRRTDDAGSLYRRLTRTAERQLTTLTRRLARGEQRGRRQSQARASYWRKRCENDGVIDWRMPSQSVHDLVRALARPYPGAAMRTRGRTCRIWKVKVLRAGRADDEPGKVIQVRRDGFVVKCGIGAVNVLEHDCGRLPRKGDYL